METKEDHVKLLLERLAQREEKVGAPQKRYYHQIQPIDHDQGYYGHKPVLKDHDQGFDFHKPVLKDHDQGFDFPKPVLKDHDQGFDFPKDHRTSYYHESRCYLDPVAHIVIYDRVVPQVPQTRRPSAGMDCNEEVKRFNGVVIKEFGKNKYSF